MSLCFAGVRLALGGRVVLDAVSFSVEATEFVGVFGPNGAGKTTLMRAALGLVPVQAGTVRVFGGTPAAGRRWVGYMPQGRSDPGTRLSGWDFVASASGGTRWGLPIASAAERLDVGRVLELVGAERLAARPLRELSGGERQRLLLAQALLGSPRLLLLDEPLISLDPHAGAEMIALVRRLQRALGIAVLFSAHELNALVPVLDRVLYLARGRVALGAVDAVVNDAVLSALYGAPMSVVRAGERRFVVPG